MKKVVAIGELLWDVLPSGKKMGGAPMNFAYWAAKSGCRSGIVSAIGRDPLGDELLSGISGLGVDLSALQVRDFPTGTVEVTLSASGEPSYDIHRGVAWDNIQDTEEAYAMVRDADALCWGSLVQRTEACREAVLRLVDACPETALKVFDVNMRQDYYTAETIEKSLERADVLKLNENELPEILRLMGVDGIEAMMDRFNLSYVIYTLGADHSEVIGREERSVIPTPKVDVVSTVGAGDSFTATFVAEMLKGTPMREAHAKAVEVSANVCTRDGAIF